MKKMNKRFSIVFAAALWTALSLGSFPVKMNAQEDDHSFRGFAVVA
jgi:hypothetical protein